MEDAMRLFALVVAIVIFIVRSIVSSRARRTKKNGTLPQNDTARRRYMAPHEQMGTPAFPREASGGAAAHDMSSLPHPAQETEADASFDEKTNLPAANEAQAPSVDRARLRRMIVQREILTRRGYR